MRSLVVIATCSLMVAACQLSSVEITKDSFIQWAGETAMVLDADRWSETPAADLGALDDCVAGAEVVMLGEADHYVVEKYDYRLVMIRYLVEHGFRWIGMEMGYSDGLRVDDYLETGDATYLDQVALYGFRASARTDRDDVPNAFSALMDVPFQSAFVEAEVSFLGSLRALSESSPDRVHWFGFDIDPFPGGGYDDIERLLRPHRSDPIIADVAARLARVPDESRLDEAERLESLEVLLDAEAANLETMLGLESLVEVRRLIRNLIESLRFRDLAYQEPLGSQWMNGLRYREALLIDRLDSNWPPPEDAKVILMGHNLHLSERGADLRSGSIDEAAPTLGYPSFGSGVAERMETCTIWMLYDHGTSADALSSDPYFEVASEPDRIEHLLTEVGSVFVLDLNDDDPRASWLDREVNFVSNGGYASGRLADQADVIFFIDEVHAVGATG